MSSTRATAPRYLATLLLALGAALVADRLHVPLPWFLGPLLALASANLLNLRMPSLPKARDGGQWIIGTALGLYFTPAVTREIGRLAPWLVVNIAFVIVLGLVGAWVLRRLSGEDRDTCFFATPIGGASEMATQAERYGARVDRVAAAHSLRIAVVSIVVPFVLQALSVHGADPYNAAAVPFSPVGLLVLAAVTGGGAIVLARLGISNEWMLGPLLVAAVLTAQDINFSSLPTPVSNGGQLLIGIALGARFTPEFFRAAPRYLASVAAVTALYLVAAALFGWGLARVAGMTDATAIVATTPGGIGEMSITAKVLALGAPIVAAFHSIRMTAVVLLVGPLYRLVCRHRG